jgi:Glycosyl hydrolase catalytic core
VSKATLRVMSKARAWTGVLAVALLGLAIIAPAAQALPTNFWGVVPQVTPSDDQFQRLKRGGARSVRVPIEWGGVQSVKGGPFNWSGVDAMIARITTNGIEVLPFLTGAPHWAVPAIFVPGTGKTAKAPAHLPSSGAAAGAWSSFVKQAAARYGPNGAFWAEHPGLAPRPIRTWQIWNEANFKYFVARPNPAEYGRLVKLSYRALKAVDPGAKAILGGLFGEPSEAVVNYRPPRAYFATDFLEQMYETTPGVKAMFNGVALHPYTGRYQRLRPQIEDFREVLSDNRDAGKRLWITELSWSSKPPSGPTDVLAKGLTGQATQLKGAFRMLKKNQARWKLQRVYWFSVDDQAGTCNFCDGSGLFAEGFVPKKSWFAYAKLAGGTP